MPFILHGIMTSILILLILYFSSFEFIVKHFFFLLLTFWVLCAFNSLFHFPMLLLLFGPAPELIPHHHVNRISTPSPQLKSLNNKQKAITLHSKRSCSRKKSHHCHVKNTNLNNEPSLTTITEEPSWQSSASSLSNASYRDGNISDSSVSYKSKNCAMPRTHHNLQRENSTKSVPTTDGITIDTNQPAFKSIIVSPEVTVETHHNGNQQNTKVTATANIKLEFTTSSNGTTTSTTTSSNEKQNTS
jgi:patched 1